MSAWMIYLFNTTGKLSVLFLGIAALMMVFAMLTGVGFAESKDPKLGKMAKNCFIYALISAVIGCALPSKQAFVEMTVIPAVVNNENVQKLPNEILGYISAWVRENTPKAAK